MSGRCFDALLTVFYHTDGLGVNIKACQGELMQRSSVVLG